MLIAKQIARSRFNSQECTGAAQPTRHQGPATLRRTSLIHSPSQIIQTHFREIGFVPSKTWTPRLSPFQDPPPAECSYPPRSHLQPLACPRHQQPQIPRQPARTVPATLTIKTHFRILSFVPSKARTPHFKPFRNPPPSSGGFRVRADGGGRPSPAIARHDR
jgi:hypothetical protein